MTAHLLGAIHIHFEFENKENTIQDNEYYEYDSLRQQLQITEQVFSE